MEFVLSDLNRTGSIILLSGDFNMDLLTLNDKIVINDYLDIFFQSRVLSINYTADKSNRDKCHTY